MLQTAVRNRDASLDSRSMPMPGEELKRSARRLHDAIELMELAIASRPRPQPVVQNHEEHQRLAAACVRLEQENADLTRQLADMRTRHAEVSQQVIGLSARLEALISRLGRLLEE